MIDRNRAFPLLALAFVVSACSAAEEEAPPAPAQTATGTNAVAPEGGAVVEAEPSVATATAIPDNFRGVWDYAEGNCMASSDLRMEVRANEIEFYESLGTVTSIEVESPNSIVVDLAMSGEGETWQITNRYVLSDGGTILTPLETEDNPQYRPMPRKRCT